MQYISQIQGLVQTKSDIVGAMFYAALLETPVDEDDLFNNLLKYVPVNDHDAKMLYNALNCLTDVPFINDVWDMYSD